MKTLLQVNGQNLKGILENQKAQKVVVLAHGFTGNLHGPNQIFDRLSETLQKEGYAVLRFNFRGTPPSEGLFQDMTLSSEIDDLRAVLSYADKHYDRIILLGESMGGTVSIKAWDSRVNSLILWYPAFDFSETALREYLTPQALAQVEKEGYIEYEQFKVGKQFIEQIPDIQIYEDIKRIDCQKYFLHGDSDAIVPVHQTQKAFALAQEPKRMHILSGAKHCFRQEQETAIRLTLEFLKEVH